MSDLFDRFAGGAEELSEHTADSGDTWGPSGTNKSTDGSGSAYPPYPMASPSDFLALSSSTPPSADYAVSVVFGAGFRQSQLTGAGPAIRATASDTNNWDYYVAAATPGTPDTITLCAISAANGSAVIGWTGVSSANMPSQIAAGDTLTVNVTGMSTPVLTVYHNGVQIFQATDTSGQEISTAGSAGMHMTVSGALVSTDVIRTMWAGSIGGPAAGITPSSATVVLNRTQSFSVTGLLPNELPMWSAGTGSITPATGSNITYTAPSSGASDAVTWTSLDLPTHTAAAPVALTSPTPTPTPAPTPSPTPAPTPTPTPTPAPTPPHGHKSRRGPSRRRRSVLPLDFPLPDKERK